MSDQKSFKRLLAEFLIQLTNWPAMFVGVAVTVGTELYLPGLAPPFPTLVVTYTVVVVLLRLYKRSSGDSEAGDDTTTGSSPSTTTPNGGVSSSSSIGSSADPSPRNADVHVYRDGAEVEIETSGGLYIIEADGAVGKVSGPADAIVDRGDRAIEFLGQSKVALLDGGRLKLNGNHVADIDSDMAYDSAGNAIAVGDTSTRRMDMAAGALVALGKL